MAHHTNCRPKNDGKEPDKDADQRDWMRDQFNQLTSSGKKNRRGSQTDQQRQFTAHSVPKTRSGLSPVGLFGLSRHAREHIEFMRLAQSTNSFLHADRGKSWRARTGERATIRATHTAAPTTSARRRMPVLFFSLCERQKFFASDFAVFSGVDSHLRHLHPFVGCFVGYIDIELHNECIPSNKWPGHLRGMHLHVLLPPLGFPAHLIDAAHFRR